jgi:hypothetical protein
VIDRYSWEARLSPLDAVLGEPLRPAKDARVSRVTDVPKKPRRAA